MKWFTSIAVASLAAALGFTSVASADVNIYGRVTAGAVHVDNDMENDDGSWDFGSNKPGLATRFGLRGEQDLGNGMSAGFHIERNVTESAFDKRHNLVWLSGGWGKLTLGNQNNPFMKARKWDQTFLYGGNWGHGSGYRHEGIGYSMSNGPFSLNVLARASVAGSGDTPGTFGLEDADMDPSTDPTPLAGLGTTNASGGTTETSGDDSIDGWVLHVGYDFGVASLDIAHQTSDKDFDITSPATAADSPTAAQTALASNLNDGAVDTGAVGYTRDMGPGLRFIAEYAAHDHDLEGNNVGSDRSRLGLAIRYVF